MANSYDARGIAAPTPNSAPSISLDGSAAAIREVERLALATHYITNVAPGMTGLPEEIPVGVDPKTGKLYSIKNLLEEFRKKPWRKLGTAQVDTLAAFIDLVKRHKTANSAIFVKAIGGEPKLTAVIDYHGPEEPAFGAHRVEYTFPLSDEIRAWRAQSGKAMSQAEFAAFLEQNVVALASPTDGEASDYQRLFKERVATPGDLLGLARELEVRATQHVKSATRLQSGERVVHFAEEHTNAKGEPVVIPGVFIIAIPAFAEGEIIRVPALLRYRPGSGGVSFTYLLWHAEEFIRQAVRADAAKAQGETGLPSFEGTPEGASA